MPSADAIGSDSQADRLRRIQVLTDTELARLEVDQLLVERVGELLGVDTGAVLLLDSSRSYLVATAALGLEASGT